MHLYWHYCASRKLPSVIQLSFFTASSTEQKLFPNLMKFQICFVLKLLFQTFPIFRLFVSKRTPLSNFKSLSHHNHKKQNLKLCCQIELFSRLFIPTVNYVSYQFYHYQSRFCEFNRFKEFYFLNETRK